MPETQRVGTRRNVYIDSRGLKPTAKFMLSLRDRKSDFIIRVPASGIHYIPADLPALKELLKVFGEAFDEIETYQSHIPSDDYLSTLLADPNFIPLVALVDDKVVGGLAAYVLKKFEQERSEIYIYDLAVLENYRRRGIATGLISKLREVARETGAWVIYVQADHGDDPAIKLYESLGAREDVLHFDIVP